ncbi:MAG: metallophosphoesterase [Candidatus Margulisbacteria bacterium]|nr:metallophosphoesterase [Candidatus Margulisiibacteriota bacterium]
MRKLQVFGDLHGRSLWQDKLDVSAAKIIFLGDYVDEFALTDEQILDNLTALLAFKQSNPEKVVLLWGNHDLAYLLPKTFSCSGYRPSYARKVRKMLASNFALFQAAYQQENWLFTHAGLSRQFWQNELQGAGAEYAAALNEMFKYKFDRFALASGYRGGAAEYGSIFWADLREFVNADTWTPRPESWLGGLNQVVGHHPVSRKKTYEYAGSKMTWIDTWSYPYYKEDAVYWLLLPE